MCLTGEAKYEENWKELTKMLNNTLGPKKSVDEWKTVRFKNFKLNFHSLKFWFRSFITGKDNYERAPRNWSKFRMEKLALMISWHYKSSPMLKSVHSSYGRRIFRIKISLRWVSSGILWKIFYVSVFVVGERGKNCALCEFWMAFVMCEKEKIKI